MDNIKAIFNELQSTNSKTEKEQILKSNANNQLLRDTLNFILNPFITTGLSDKKMKKQVVVNPTKEFKDVREVMDYLHSNNTGTDENIANVQNFINQQPECFNDLYETIFTKSIKLGCAANTVNKVYGKNFIPQFECMLAEKYFDYSEKIIGKDFSLTLKLDGIRCLAVKKGKKAQLISRQGQLITGLTEIEKELLKRSSRDFVLDGELLVSYTEGMASKDQYKATTKIVRKDGEKVGITFRAFDYLEHEEFINQSGIVQYIDRRKMLESNFDGMNHIKVLPILYTGNDHTQIIKYLDIVRDKEQEGLMLNINDAKYEFKRTQNILKVKVMQDCDLRIIGFEEGKGKFTGTLGRLNVDYKGNVLGVGSGFTDIQREWFWKNQTSLIGRVVSIQYFEETKNKDGILSLRFPVFKEIREIGKTTN